MAFHEASMKALQHLELAERFLAEGRGLIGKDPIQASEMLCKAAEEAIKAIAIALGLDETRKALERGGGRYPYWTTLFTRFPRS